VILSWEEREVEGVWQDCSEEVELSVYWAVWKGLEDDL